MQKKKINILDKIKKYIGFLTTELSECAEHEKKSTNGATPFILA